MKTSNQVNYTYSGPSSGVTLDDGREVLFWDGKDYTLPSENEYIQSLVDRGHLTEVGKPAQKKTKQTAPKADTKEEKV